MALSQHEQQILAELEAQLTRRHRREPVVAPAWMTSPVLYVAMAVVGLALLVASTLVWWPLGVAGYALASVGLIQSFRRSPLARALLERVADLAASRSPRRS